MITLGKVFFFKLLGMRVLVEIIVEGGSHLLRKLRREEKEIDLLMKELKEDIDDKKKNAKDGDQAE